MEVKSPYRKGTESDLVWLRGYEDPDYMLPGCGWSDRLIDAYNEGFRESCLDRRPRKGWRYVENWEPHYEAIKIFQLGYTE